MKETITKNEKSLKVLNEMVSRNYYKGTMDDQKFVLKRRYSHNNLIISGVVNEENRFVLKAGLGATMQFLSYIFLVFFLCLTMVFLLKSNWIMLMLLLFSGVIFYVPHVLKAKKELRIFTNRYFELYKLIHKE